MSASALPKDVDLCAKCNTANSKHASRCRECGETLPWAQKKVAQAASPAPSSEKAFKPRSPVAEAMSNLHWGGAIAFLFLVIGVFLLSIVWPFAGFKMYRYFSDEHNNLAYAAAAGLGTLFIGIMVIMLVAGSGHQAAP